MQPSVAILLWRLLAGAGRLLYFLRPVRLRLSEEVQLQVVGGVARLSVAGVVDKGWLTWIPPHYQVEIQLPRAFSAPPEVRVRRVGEIEYDEVLAHSVVLGLRRVFEVTHHGAHLKNKYSMEFQLLLPCDPRSFLVFPAGQSGEVEVVGDIHEARLVVKRRLGLDFPIRNLDWRIDLGNQLPLEEVEVYRNNERLPNLRLRLTEENSASLLPAEVGLGEGETVATKYQNAVRPQRDLVVPLTLENVDDEMEIVMRTRRV